MMILYIVWIKILTIIDDKHYEKYCDRAKTFAEKNADYSVVVKRMADAIERWMSGKPVPDDYTEY